MPRGRKAVNPFPEGSAEHEQEEYARIAAAEKKLNDPPPTERNITVTVSIEAIQAAKSLAVLSGMTYRQILGEAAREGVEDLAQQVRDALKPKNTPAGWPE